MKQRSPAPESWSTLRLKVNKRAGTYATEDAALKDVVGLLPAGGAATRISPLPCSKELYPIGFGRVHGTTERRPKVVCHYLFEKMRRANITKAYVILKQGKWDIPAYLGDGKTLDMDLAYLMMDLPYGPPYTLNQAYPFIKDNLVAFGFPDILFRPDDVFTKLLVDQQQSSADAVLGLFPADQPTKMDMVDVDQNGQVRRIVANPSRTNLSHSWAAAIWSPIFTQFLNEFVRSHEKLAASMPESSVGDVIQAAVNDNLNVRAIKVSSEPYLDIGTPEGILTATKRFALEELDSSVF